MRPPPEKENCPWGAQSHVLGISGWVAVYVSEADSEWISLVRKQALGFEIVLLNYHQRWHHWHCLVSLTQIKSENVFFSSPSSYLWVVSVSPAASRCSQSCFLSEWVEGWQPVWLMAEWVCMCVAEGRAGGGSLVVDTRHSQGHRLYQLMLSGLSLDQWLRRRREGMLFFIDDEIHIYLPHNGR